MRRIAITGLVVLVALVVLPVADGARPIRELIHPGEPVVIPAGLGCPFDVGWDVDPARAFGIVTWFSDGRVMTVGHGEPTLTNLDTGTSYLQVSRYEITEVYDEAANDALGEGHGRIAWSFYPGDQGPFGEVGENGEFYSLIADFRYTFDLDTELVTSFEFSGSATDLCQILAAE